MTKLKCPFCDKEESDLNEMKTHLIKGQCKVYNETPSGWSQK